MTVKDTRPPSRHDYPVAVRCKGGLLMNRNITRSHPLSFSPSITLAHMNCLCPMISLTNGYKSNTTDSLVSVVLSPVHSLFMYVLYICIIIFPHNLAFFTLMLSLVYVINYTIFPLPNLSYVTLIIY